MPTQNYYNANGERIPGNTTVIGGNLGWKTGGLLGWMRKSLMTQMCPTCLANVKDPNDIKEEAADAGTLAHAMIEAAIKKRPQPEIGKYATDIVKKACRAYDNYLEWAEQTHLEIITMEVPCVSEVWQFGTTVDCVAKVAGKLSIVEVKTSNDVYAEYLIQLSAQRQAWDETHDDKIKALHILKLGKEEATFAHHYYEPGALLAAFEAFKDLRDLHEKKKILTKLI